MTNTDDRVIDGLEKALETANHKTVKNCAIVLVFDDGTALDYWANDGYKLSMIGALETLKNELLNI